MRIEAQQSSKSRPKVSKSGRASDDFNELSERKQRKREIDRRSQQNKREKVKTRIAYLEGLVEILKPQDGSVNSLANQLSEAVEERDRLSETLTGVRRLLSSLEVKTRPDVVAKLSSLGPENDSADQSSIGAENAVEPSSSIDNTGRPPIETEYDVGLASQTTDPRDLNLTELPDITTNICRGSHISHAAYGACECNVTTSVSRAGSGPSLWRYTDYVLSEHFRSQELIVAPEDAMSQDTFVRALVHGWNSIGPTSSMPLSWRTLRRIDEHYFSMCSHVERLAAMLAFYPLLQYHREPTLQRRSKVPKWLLKRYSSCNCFSLADFSSLSPTAPHSYTVSFVAWYGPFDRPRISYETNRAH